MCPLWKRWRSVEKGKETAEDCRQFFLDFLASLNTLTVDGKKREGESAGVDACGVRVEGGSKSIPRMMVPDEAHLPRPLLPGVGERVKVTGMIKKSEYNGRSATVAKLLDGERICVVLDEGEVAVETGQELSVKHENLETLLLENLQKLVVESEILEHQLQKTTQSTPLRQPSPAAAPAAGAAPRDLFRGGWQATAEKLPKKDKIGLEYCAQVERHNNRQGGAKQATGEETGEEKSEAPKKKCVVC
jgi:hypothetical protein